MIDCVWGDFGGQYSLKGFIESQRYCPTFVNFLCAIDWHKNKFTPRLLFRFWCGFSNGLLPTGEVLQHTFTLTDSKCWLCSDYGEALNMRFTPFVC